MPVYYVFGRRGFFSRVILRFMNINLCVYSKNSSRQTNLPGAIGFKRYLQQAALEPQQAAPALQQILAAWADNKPVVTTAAKIAKGTKIFFMSFLLN
jgi:hypothetical protein